MLSSYITQSEKLEFDVVVPDLNLGVEVKAIVRRGLVQLRDPQNSKYLRLQLNEEQPHGRGSALKADRLGDPRILVYIFRHHGDDLVELFVKPDQNEFVKELSSSIDDLLIMSFSLYHQIHSTGIRKSNSITSRYVPKEDATKRQYDPHTKLSKPGLNLLINSPDDALRVFGLNPEDYQKRRFVFPSEVYLEGTPITPFPILQITDTNYSRWVNKLQEIKAQK